MPNMLCMCGIVNGFQPNRRMLLAPYPRGGLGFGILPMASSSFPQKPTTGLLAITLALHFCDLVHIAGFGYPDSANKKQTIHYYEQITLKSMAVSVPLLCLSPSAWGTALVSPPPAVSQASEHNISHEAVAIKRMLELGLVKNLTYF